MACHAGVQPRWIQGDSKVGGRSRRLWKNTYLITDIERLEMDSVVGRLVEKNLGSGGTQVRILWAGSSSCVCFSTKNPGHL